MDVIALLFRNLEKDNVKLKLEPNANATHSTKMDTQPLLSLKSAVNIKSRPTALPKQ